MKKKIVAAITLLLIVSITVSAQLAKNTSRRHKTNKCSCLSPEKKNPLEIEGYNSEMLSEGFSKLHKFLRNTFPYYSLYYQENNSDTAKNITLTILIDVSLGYPIPNPIDYKKNDSIIVSYSNLGKVMAKSVYTHFFYASKDIEKVVFSFFTDDKRHNSIGNQYNPKEENKDTQQYILLPQELTTTIIGTNSLPNCLLLH
jgi:hypothetical protein